MRPIRRRRSCLGSARVPHVGERVLAIADFSLALVSRKDGELKKDCFGGTPKPARETRALPIRIPNAPCQSRARSGQFASLLKSTLRFVHFAPRQSQPFQFPC